MSGVPRNLQVWEQTKLVNWQLQFSILCSIVNLAMRSQCCIYKYYPIIFDGVFKFRIFTDKL